MGPMLSSPMLVMALVQSQGTRQASEQPRPQASVALLGGSRGLIFRVLVYHKP